MHPQIRFSTVTEDNDRISVSHRFNSGLAVKSLLIPDPEFRGRNLAPPTLLPL